MKTIKRSSFQKITYETGFYDEHRHFAKYQADGPKTKDVVDRETMVLKEYLKRLAVRQE